MSTTHGARSGADQLPDDVREEIALEQRHVTRVYDELAKAGERVSLVENEGLARGRASRSGDMRDEEKAGLFERDALMFSAGKRRATLEQQFEGLVFGRLDLDHSMTAPQPSESGDGREGYVSTGTGVALEARYIGRLGVRDDDYEPLVIDWRAPAASPFYRATPGSPEHVVRRRVLRCRDSTVIGVEDDLMTLEAPEGMTVEELVSQGRTPYQGLLGRGGPDDDAIVQRALEATSTADLADRQALSLSGGQRQRVWLAMALAQNTDILLLDEPTSFLDIGHAVELLDVVKQRNADHGTTVVMVLHDLLLAARYADHLVAMHDGEIVAQGPPRDVMTAELAERLYGVPCVVLEDPTTGAPVVLPR